MLTQSSSTAARSDLQIYWLQWTVAGIAVLAALLGIWATLWGRMFWGGAAVMSLAVVLIVVAFMARGLEKSSLQLGDFLRFKAAARNRRRWDDEQG